MKKQRIGTPKKPLSRNDRILGLAVHDLEKIAAFGLVLGYLQVGLIEIGPQAFAFTLRGPIFWRLTAGTLPYLRKPSTGLAADAYLRIEALLAYLLLVGEAHLTQSTTAASTMVWTIGSERFRFTEIGKLLKGDSTSFRYRTAILMLLNVAVGLGLVVRKLPFEITAVSMDRSMELMFSTSAAPLQRSVRRLPSQLTLPRMSGKLYWLGVIVGILLIGQQARIGAVLMERGGLIGFGIRSALFRMQVLQEMLRRKVEQEDEAEELRGD
ncbi:hypothetical protein [Alicyclobacillus sp. ALC3]|uniref:hypothetical protein n=1 Tax=Alicyclobacillus sp. ALC3 TaxID=2796143 RepID=UPI00237843D1|nr:hypothetical protein [Alicyclobacillus sp. ALC3]WDL97871.1 hypothetical protein JC200_03855 [Alicyclobacillus sp. ALC3]